MIKKANHNDNASDDNEVGLLTQVWWDIPIGCLVLNVALCMHYVCRDWSWIMRWACNNDKRFAYKGIEEHLVVGEEEKSAQAL